MVRSRACLSSYKATMRQAFTMIELIFAIVVIAVVMLTIPMMIQTNNKALETSTAQEAIFMVSSVLSEATTLLWDDNSLGGSTALGAGVTLSKVLDVNGSGDATYDRWDQSGGVVDNTSAVRKGGMNEDMHRQFLGGEQRPAQGGTVVDTINESFDSAATGALLGLKNQYSITATRIYISDTPNTPFVFATVGAGQQTNIKMIQVEINATIDGTLQTISRLRAYTCNIGEVDFAKRRF